MNFYELEFETKKGGCVSWIIHIEARNAKAAKEKMVHMWATNRNVAHMHQFGITVRKMKYNEEFLYHYFKKVI